MDELYQQQESSPITSRANKTHLAITGFSGYRVIYLAFIFWITIYHKVLVNVSVAVNFSTTTQLIGGGSGIMNNE